MEEGHLFFFLETTSYFKCPSGGSSVFFVAQNQNAAYECDTYVSLQRHIMPWKTFSCLLDDTWGHIHSEALWAFMSRSLDFVLPL